MNTKEYYLGLDMGVASVGWAVTDVNYNLLRAKGKDLWGIREFDEAETAEKRRMYRTNRRRRQREVVRIGLLKEYFHDEIQRVDPDFYLRLENSKYYLEDKDGKLKSKNGIFNDETYQDVDYYKEFPTIFHLRKALINQEEPRDIRLVYLALANMFKHRGHFLNTGLSDEGTQKSFETVFAEFDLSLQEKMGFSPWIEGSAEGAKAILMERDFSRRKKAELLKELFKLDAKEKHKQEFVKVLCGLKGSIPKLFPDVELEKKLEICFADYDYEEKIPEVMEAIGDDYFEILEIMKELYDISSIEKIMKGYRYLSEARVAEYEKHKKDLKILKEVVKAYQSGEVYDFLFRSGELGTYSAYVNSVNSQAIADKSRRNVKGRSRDDLYKTLKKYMADMPQEDERVVYITSEMEKETFLPKQRTGENGVIPNQIHAREMKKILENAEKSFAFLKEKDASGYTVSERILKLFTFQIPYYIGPTSIQSKTGWAVRKEEGAVLPWNLEEKIDVKASSEQFISRMVRRCSYLNGEMVLPKASLEYESFCVLNQINTIAIDGERISVPLKQQIYNEIFKKRNKVTKKQLVSYLVAQGLIQEESQLSGIDIEWNSSLSTYRKFREIFGDRMEEDSVKKMIEQIVFWGTIYGESKQFLKEKIEETYGEYLTKEEIKRITGFKFKDWGRLSKEFLELPGCDTSIGEHVSLIRMMWNTNLNLTELLYSNAFSYKEELAARQKQAIKNLCEITPEDLDDYYFSAPVKRMIWQTLLVVREVEEILGCPPERVFVEMIRKPDERKRRTTSRKEKFTALYKKLGSESREWIEVIEKADADGTLRTKKMYLYLTQMGRCMYTGDEIPLGDLFKDNLYDIDHIYPRCMVKDDAIDNNLVLVKRQANKDKDDDYPIKDEIRQARKELWKRLLDQGLISEEKYRRLTGRDSFTEEQRAEFIARQFVETSQATKTVASLLEKVLPGSEIVYAKASNVSEFRQKRDLVKCRSLNEFHHAHDAYLNIVVGNVYYVKFTKNPLHFIQKEYRKDSEHNHYHLGRMYDWDVVRNGEVAWVAPKENGAPGTIEVVKKTLARNTPLMTRRSFEGHGAIANETLCGKKKVNQDKYIPLKSGNEKMLDMSKYGGYTSVSTAYFFLVEHTEKKKRVRTLETVPVFMVKKIEKNPEELMKYCIEGLGLIEPDIRIPKIKLQSLVKRNGYFLYISGKTGNRICVRNAVNLCLNQKWVKYVKAIDNFMERGYMGETITAEENEKLYQELTSKFSSGIFSKRPNPVGGVLEKRKEKFTELTLEEQCNVLSEILKLTAGGTNSANLEAIGETKHAGVMLFSKKISEADEFWLIYQSVTGVYEKRINLLTV